MCPRYKRCEIDPVSKFPTCVGECGIDNGKCPNHLLCQLKYVPGNQEVLDNGSSNNVPLHPMCFNPPYSKFFKNE